MLENNEIYLKSIEREDLKERINWINNINNHEILGFDWPISLAKTEKWFQNQLSDSSKLNFSIFLKDTNKIIGMTGLLNIDIRNLKAEFYVTIGDEKYRGKGFARQIIELVLEYGFLELGLNKIYLTTFEENKKAQKIYEKNNFKLEGILRKDKFHMGQLKNIYVYSILKDEWR